MTDEQTPAAGPLTAESVKLLVKGDLMRALETTCAFCEGEILTFEGPGPAGECMVFGMSWMAKRFTFLGRPDQDGWIAWSGGENPVPGLKIDWRNKSGASGTWLSDEVAGFGQPLNGNYRITHYRPHVASPASSSSVVQGEASGVEREYCDNCGTVRGRTNECDCSLHDGTPPVWVVPSPQPSGETREADLESGEMRTLVVNIVERYVTGWGGEYADNPYDAAPLLAGEILDLIRPAPVASPDQPEQGGGMEVVAWRVKHPKHDAHRLCFVPAPGDVAEALTPAEPAEVRVRELEREVEALTKALTGLTCGGSEFFTRKGDRFVADIPACVDWVLRSRHDAHRRTVDAIKRATAAEAQLAKAKEALERIRKPEYGIGFNGLRKIARQSLAALQEAGEVG